VNLTSCQASIWTAAMDLRALRPQWIGGPAISLYSQGVFHCAIALVRASEVQNNGAWSAPPLRGRAPSWCPFSRHRSGLQRWSFAYCVQIRLVKRRLGTRCWGHIAARMATSLLQAEDPLQQANGVGHGIGYERLKAHAADENQVRMSEVSLGCVRTHIIHIACRIYIYVPVYMLFALMSPSQLG
jgi:hypothetical protein